MTTVEVLFRYSLHPTEAAMSALGNLREVYGIRRLLMNEAEQTIRIEYDATRLSVATVEKLLRNSGITVADQIPLIPPQPSVTTDAARVAGRPSK